MIYSHLQNSASHSSLVVGGDVEFGPVSFNTNIFFLVSEGLQRLNGPSASEWESIQLFCLSQYIIGIDNCGTFLLDGWMDS